MTDQPDGGKPEKKLISLRLPLPLLTAIDDFAWRHRTDRSDIIEKSCRHYITSIPCPQCQTLNPPTGKHCALCGAELTRPDHWIETLRYTTDELMFRQRKLCTTETSLETSLFSLEDCEDEIKPEQKPFLTLQINETRLLLKEIQNTILLSDRSETTTDIRAAETLLQTPDLSQIPEMISRISHRLAEIEQLEDTAAHLIEYNQKFLDTLDTL
ncbi:zinc ribbon domain-containing protein [Methanocorpusculum sp. MG]|uniref:Zinc ribbon domain-containing protein n=1 Tax=Methanocorpusculum petauri TaxID=3002863 RepID=A0ABT4IHN7_9EURY|nr:zinc ribbon domain-containing protein [Methanocorpusculum petauri]MCZ0861250.1 zinc ribbon domain-containing protein [Methanocorpusculum petauri]